nr:immunoglobulin heavy chain junction region [Mus musculus]
CTRESNLLHWYFDVW